MVLLLRLLRTRRKSTRGITLPATAICRVQLSLTLNTYCPLTLSQSGQRVNPEHFNLCPNFHLTEVNALVEEHPEYWGPIVLCSILLATFRAKENYSKVLFGRSLPCTTTVSPGRAHHGSASCRVLQ